FGLFAIIYWRDYEGAWLAFVGWFLLTAAKAELGFVQAVSEGGRPTVEQQPTSLAGMRVRDVMVRDPVTTTPDLSLGRFVEQAWASRYASYPVVADGRPVGIVSLPRVLAVPRRHWEEYRVADLMTPLASALV